MKIIVVDNAKELGKKAYFYVKGLLANKPNAVLGLATGSTPIPLYAEMIADFRAGNTSYNNVKTFNLDEYVNLPPSHPETYNNFMRRNLFDGLDIDFSNVHIPNGAAEDMLKECQNYSAMLASADIDLQVLGIGANGHIGFNEPKTSFASTTHIVNLTQKTISDNARFFKSIDEVPTQAITMGIGEILKAKTILLLATGANKAEAIHAAVKGQISEDCPASALQLHKNVIVIIDKAAASKL